MLNTDFTIDMSVWQEGVTFQSSLASKPAALFEIKQYKEHEEVAKTLAKPAPQNIKPVIVEKTTPVVEASKQAVGAPIVITPMANSVLPTTLVAQETKVQEIPAALADVEDLTPFIVSAKTNKPGNRLNEQLERTEFTKNKHPLFAEKGSPYNMSEEKAIAREQVKKVRKLKGVGNAKIFSMANAARHNDTRIKAPVGEALKTAELQHAHQGQTPINLEAIKSQVSSGGFGYQRETIPNSSSQELSPATAWFPEAMTRQLDAYEATNRIAQYNNAPQNSNLEV